MSMPMTPVVPEVPHTGAVLAGLLLITVIVAGMVQNIRFFKRARLQGWPVPKEARRLLQRPLDWRDALWLVLVMAVLLSAMALAGQVLSRWDGDLSPGTIRGLLVFQNLVTHGVALGLVIHLCRRNGGWTAAMGGAPAPWRQRGMEALSFYLGAMPVIAVTALVTHALWAYAGIPVEPQPVIGGFLDIASPPWFKAWLTVTAIITAPVIEEMVFRGVLLPAAARQHGIPAGVALVSLLFAVVHGHPPAIAPLFVVGVFLSLSYLHTGSLVVPVLMHAVFNGVNLAAIYLTGIGIPPG